MYMGGLSVTEKHDLAAFEGTIKVVVNHHNTNLERVPFA